MRQSLIMIATLALVIEGASAQTHPIRIRGTIASAKGDDLTVKARQGKTIDLDLTKGYFVGAVKKATLSDIKPNTI